MSEWRRPFFSTHFASDGKAVPILARDGGRFLRVSAKATCFFRFLLEAVRFRCADCNSQKGEESAEDFLRKLYRQRRLTADDLENRLRALDSLAAGDLRPVLPTGSPSSVPPRGALSSYS